MFILHVYILLRASSCLLLLRPRSLMSSLAVSVWCGLLKPYIVLFLLPTTTITITTTTTTTTTIHPSSLFTVAGSSKRVVSG
ncbi:hypothetical protein E2C01_082610 [Portunus trituberculatus]|uniref:Uncharacterized protein n=1 Tax=Portunus trituberculatus TaxID=210409 RepID=A0A5B7J263_PORTR|nr:hypothetical protein [Portunus trituberculatus]